MKGNENVNKVWALNILYNGRALFHVLQKVGLFTLPGRAISLVQISIGIVLNLNLEKERGAWRAYRCTLTSAVMISVLHYRVCMYL